MSFGNEGNDSDLRAPFPWFGGKRRAADLIWQRLGNPSVYLDPFAGSLAALLCRPIPPHVDATGLVETVNDLDGYVVNAWRSIAWHPEETSRHADWPVTELDLHARHDWLLSRRESIAERLREDPEWCDPRAAGWWIWGACAWIGSGWCATRSRKLPHLGNTGRGVHARGSRQLPHLGNTGVGVHARSDRLDFGPLSARLRRVRVTCGDWRRILTRAGSTAMLHGLGLTGEPVVGVLFDPPYDGHESVYAEPGSVAGDVVEWCAKHGPKPEWRIVLCGYGEMPPALAAQGWTEDAWTAKGGYAADTSRERLWCSPSCLGLRQERLL
jgi:DNA adenine methylase